ncbi:Gfo/Idh/MocA family oxidoreductase [Solibacillus daqui]|uniref:Gfo/Idh/MocA family oxidoreductase n=1 Tax=Solibacillus daqui TaxID=2912187 RepID=UPI00236607F8|nr:Gfo/Idh/MocA family oxidoreductase [Solibacillus daqui]
MKIGIIGTDSSHAVAFSERLLAKGHQIIAYQGGSTIAFSKTRIDTISAQMQQIGIPFVETLEQMQTQCDAFIITSVDATQHFEQFKQLVSCKKPVFIDKPFAQNSVEAIAIIKLASEQAIPLMSSSALRFADPVQAVKNKCIEAVDISAPLPMLEPNDYFYYGIHALEMICVLKKIPIKDVSVHNHQQQHFITVRFEDDTVSTIRGYLQNRQSFQFVTHTSSLSEMYTIAEGDLHFYDRLIDEMERFFMTKQSPIALAETLQIIRILEKMTQHAK